MNATGPTDSENRVAASGILFLSVSGLIIYTIVLFTLYKHRTFFCNSFYRYISFLGVCDCIMLVLFICYAAPLTLLQRNPFGAAFERLMGFLCNLGFYGALPTTASVAVNRYWAVCKNETLHDTFTRRNVNINFVFICAFALVFGAIPTVTACCPLNYYYSSYSWSYDMSKFDGFLSFYMLMEQTWTLLVCLTLCVAYVAILLEMRRTRNTVLASLTQMEIVERKKLESKLALQFLGVGVYMLAFDLVFNILPYLSVYHWHLYISSLMYIMNCSINPYIYLATNSQLREKVVGLFRGPNTTSVNRIKPSGIQHIEARRITARGPYNNNERRIADSRV